MNGVYNEYMQGPHSKKFKGKPRATCVDCHLPHEFFAKWIAKAQSGLGHVYAFTFKLDKLPTNLSANNKKSRNYTAKLHLLSCRLCTNSNQCNLLIPTHMIL